MVGCVGIASIRGELGIHSLCLFGDSSVISLMADTEAFGEQQINYILGDNPRASSYVCGFGENTTDPASSPWCTWLVEQSDNGSWSESPCSLGALVGGPASPDDFDYEDVRSDYIANEVACDYNAGFTAALGYLLRAYGGDASSDPMNFHLQKIRMERRCIVEASIIEDESDFARIRCMLNNEVHGLPVSDQLSLPGLSILRKSLIRDIGPEDVYRRQWISRWRYAE